MQIVQKNNSTGYKTPSSEHFRYQIQLVTKKYHEIERQMFSYCNRDISICRVQCGNTGLLSHLKIPVFRGSFFVFVALQPRVRQLLHAVARSNRTSIFCAAEPNMSTIFRPDNLFVKLDPVMICDEQFLRIH